MNVDITDDSIKSNLRGETIQKECNYIYYISDISLSDVSTSEFCIIVQVIILFPFGIQNLSAFFFISWMTSFRSVLPLSLFLGWQKTIVLSNVCVTGDLPRAKKEQVRKSNYNKRKEFICRVFFCVCVLSIGWESC